MEENNIEYMLLLSSSSDTEEKVFYSTEWLENIFSMPNSQFKETFRMSRVCFRKLLDKVKRHNGCLYSIEYKLLVFIFYFAHVSTYRKLREIFGVSHCTLFRIIEEMGNLLHEIAIKEIKFPNPNEYQELKDGFLRFSRNPGPILAIDGTLINILKPKIANPFDYYDRKGHFSVNFVCLVDHMLRFRAITYGFGKSHDARIYRNSNMRSLVENISDDSCYVIGDSAYGGFNNVRICTSSNAYPLSRDEEFMFSQQRIVVENSFGRLKGKFKRLECRIQNGETPKYIKAIKGIMWIHNFIIDNE